MKVQDQAGQYRQALKDKDVCTYIFYALAVNADGTVSACCPDWDQKLLVGDLHRQSLWDIWHSQALHRLRLLHLQDDIDAYRQQLLERLTARELSLAESE